jgi:hypothetical protein
MKSSHDLAELIQINKVLYNFINEIIADREELDCPFINVLVKRAMVLNASRNELSKLIKGIEMPLNFSGKIFLNYLQIEIIIHPPRANDPELMEFENWIILTVEAYKRVLNTTSLTCLYCRSVLMDHKFFLQGFLLDLIKYRELYPGVMPAALSV